MHACMQVLKMSCEPVFFDDDFASMVDTWDVQSFLRKGHLKHFQLLKDPNPKNHTSHNRRHGHTDTASEMCVVFIYDAVASHRIKCINYKCC